MRLLLLRHLDRLKTLSSLHKGSVWPSFSNMLRSCERSGPDLSCSDCNVSRVFDAAAFTSFKDVELIDAARQYAAAGDVGSLTLLLQHHPVALGPYILQILEAVPESMDPRMYAAVLPRVNTDRDNIGKLKPSVCSPFIY